jgi:alkanesulfonate monooxygenase
VCSGDPVENHGDGLFLDHDARYAAADEFLDIWRRLCRGETVTMQGKHLHVKDASLTLPPVQLPHPPLYLGGSSEAAMRVAAKHINCFLTWGEPPAMVAEKVSRMRALAAEQGRTIGFGIRLHVIVRETEAEAWDDAAKLIRYVDDAAVAKAKAVWARQDSVGQSRMAQLQSGGRDGLVVYPNLWAGVGLVRGGAGTALVGNPEQVAALMREYAELGIDTFILSGYPHLEEAHRVADLLFPLVNPAAGEGAIRASGEAIADTHHPEAVTAKG